MSFRDENEELRPFDGSQLYRTIVNLVGHPAEADEICRKYGIDRKSTPDQERALLKENLGDYMGDGMFDWICRRKIPLAVAALALIGLSRCIQIRSSKPVGTRAGGARGVPPAAPIRPVPAVLSLVVSSRKLKAYQDDTKVPTTQEMLELLNAATFFRCMSQSDSQQLIRDVELRDGFSTDDEEDVLVCLEVEDGADLIDVPSRYELKNRLQERVRRVDLVRSGAIGNALSLKGFKT